MEKKKNIIKRVLRGPKRHQIDNWRMFREMRRDVQEVILRTFGARFWSYFGALGTPFWHQKSIIWPPGLHLGPRASKNGPWGPQGLNFD